ncbi:hypothetical protein HGRIS_012065 [Hohenbuehelia grisea]|uniref:Uncharacterized protein n=1 Tax=Hohenbuehelia grisea TaxID=104357 RepID=A0ABR3IR85_9AGAR
MFVDATVCRGLPVFLFSAPPESGLRLQPPRHSAYETPPHRSLSLTHHNVLRNNFRAFISCVQNNNRPNPRHVFWFGITPVVVNPESTTRRLRPQPQRRQQPSTADTRQPSNTQPRRFLVLQSFYDHSASVDLTDNGLPRSVNITVKSYTERSQIESFSHSFYAHGLPLFARDLEDGHYNVIAYDNQREVPSAVFESQRSDQVLLQNCLLTRRGKLPRSVRHLRVEYRSARRRVALPFIRTISDSVNLQRLELLDAIPMQIVTYYERIDLPHLHSILVVVRPTYEGIWALEHLFGLLVAPVGLKIHVVFAYPGSRPEFAPRVQVMTDEWRLRMVESLLAHHQQWRRG